MNYQSGRMGMAEAIGLTFNITFPLVFLSTPAFLAETAGSASWTTPLIGGLISGGLLWSLQVLLARYPGDLLTLAERLLGRYAAYAISVFCMFVLFATACLWTRQFAENTLITALPLADFHQVVMVYGVSVVVLVYLGAEAMARTSYMILPFALTGLLLVMAGLSGETRPLYLFPLLGNGAVSLVKPTLMIMGSSLPAAIMITMLAPAFQSSKTIQAAIIFGYGGANVVRGVANAVYVMSFSAAVGAEKILPFYEMARLIYINKYVQRLEALFILLWVMVGIIGIALCLYGTLYIIARQFRLPTIKPLLWPMGVIMVNIAAMPPDAGVILDLGIMLFMNICAPGFAVMTFGLLAAALIRGGRKRCDSRF